MLNSQESSPSMTTIDPVLAMPHAQIEKRYQIVDELGSGGMGVVYRAYDRLTGGQIALKNVRASSFHQSADLRTVLAREFQTLASLRHPQIIRVLDYGFDLNKQPYYTMDLLEGSTTITQAAHRQTRQIKLNLLVQTLQALLYLHRRGVLHLDLKPANILVTDLQVKVVDFGLATVGQQSDKQMFGTFAYMAPELLHEQPPTAASDLYAIGVIAYEILTGKHPFDFKHEQLVESLARVLHDTPDLDALLEWNSATNAPTEIVEGSEPDADKTLLIDRASTLRLPTEPPTVVVSSTDKKPGATGSAPRLEDIIDKAFPTPQTDEWAWEGNPVQSLSDVIMRLLSRAPEDRYQDAADVIRDLERVVGDGASGETSAIRESFLQAAKFIGRKPEMDKLCDALDRAKTGSGSAWFIAGESGIGKSRLLEEIRIFALVSGALVLRGQAVENGSLYQVWQRPIARMALNVDVSEPDASTLKTIAPDLETLLGKPIPDAVTLELDEAQKRLFTTVSSLVQRQESTPILIILEDLHWAGDESMALLRHLTPLVGRLPLVIMGSYRDDETVDVPADGQVIKLNRLSAAEVVELSESMIGAPARAPGVDGLLQRETEGNAFFLVEVVRALAEEAGRLDQIGTMTLPQQVFTGGVQTVIERRLRRVPAWAMPLLKVASVIGRELDVEVLKRAASSQVLGDGRTVDAWLYACSAAAVLEVQDERWRFAHDKLREGIRKGMDDDECVRVHEQAALALETVHGDTQQYAEALADLWRTAENADKEYPCRSSAARYANQLGNNAVAVVHFERALELLAVRHPADEDHERARLQLSLAKATMRLSQFDRTLELLIGVEKAAETLNDPQLKAQAVAFHGRTAIGQGNYTEAVTILQEAQKQFQALDDSRGVADAVTSLGQINVLQGDFDSAEKYLQDSLTRMQAIGDAQGKASVYSVLAELSIYRGDYKTAEQYLGEGLALNLAIGNRNSIAGVYIYLGQVAFFLSQPLEAERYFQEGLAYFREAGEPAGIAACLNNLGYVMFATQNLDKARFYYNASMSMFETLSDNWGAAQTQVNLASIDVEDQKYDEAETRLRDAWQRAQSVQAMPLMMEIMSGYARLRLGQSNNTVAARLLKIVTEHAATSPDVRQAAQEQVDKLSVEMGNEAYQKSLENLPAFDAASPDVFTSFIT